MQMPFLLQYLLKLSIGLSVTYLFYRLALRQLTFYRWNRWYLVMYSLLCFVIPFANMLPWMERQGSGSEHLLDRLPAIADYAYLFQQQEADASPWLTGVTGRALLVFFLGMVIMLSRLVLQCLSLRRLRRNAMLLHEQDGIRLYDTGTPSAPFSFGRSVYLNRGQHGPEELDRIIRHEIVHVRQHHTADLLLAEFLCIVNWFNPFAWAIRHAIRQNLEFLADRQVLQSGLDKKEYQYLLLKVVGINQYSIGHHFNLVNLKKRIAMMNKLNSSKAHLAKFLFSLPLLVLVLAAFRQNSIANGNGQLKINPFKAVADTQPPLPPPPPPPPPAPGTPPPPPGLAIADNVLVVLNGVVQPQGKKIMKTIPAGSIERVDVLKGAAATAAWGEAGRHGVVKITTKDPKIIADRKEQPTFTRDTAVGRVEHKAEPVYMLDGVEQEPGTEPLKKLSPGNIESVHVWTDKDATTRFGEKGRNGVVDIKLKKDHLVTDTASVRHK